MLGQDFGTTRFEPRTDFSKRGKAHGSDAGPASATESGLPLECERRTALLSASKIVSPGLRLEVSVSRYTYPSEVTERKVDPSLSEREYAILHATRSNSLSTVAIAEHVGLGSDPLKVLPLLERLEQLELLDGFYAAGRTTASLEVHRRYYKSSERGRLIAATAV